MVNNTFPLNEMENCDEFLKEYSDRLNMYENDLYEWNETLNKWNKLNNHQWLDICSEYLRSLPEKAEKVKRKKDKELARSWASKCQNMTKVNNLAKMAMSKISRYSMKELDSNYNILAVKNGYIDLIEGKFYPPDKTKLYSKQANVFYDCKSNIMHTEFMNRLLKWQFNEDEINYLQVLFGYCLHAHNLRNLFIICYGEGSNGKSLLQETLHSIMGDYGRIFDVSSLLPGSVVAGHRSDLLNIRGSRMIFSNELPEGTKLDEAKIKSLCSSEVVSARQCHQGDYIQFLPTYTPMLSVNHLPIFTDLSHGLWRRIITIPFDKTVHEEDIDSSLPLRIYRDETNEKSAILNWLIEGLRKYNEKDNMPEVPERFCALQKDYRKESNPFQDWMQTNCVIEKDNENIKSTTNDLTTSYNNWAKENNCKIYTQTALSRKFRSMGFKKITNPVSMFCGIRLIKTNSKVDDEMPF